MRLLRVMRLRLRRPISPANRKVAKKEETLEEAPAAEAAPEAPAAAEEAPAAETPAEEAPAKPKRTRKAAAPKAEGEAEA